MVNLGRAAKIIALLLGFYLLCAVVIACMVGLDYLAFKLVGDLHGNVGAMGKFVVALVVATVGVIIVVLRGLFVSVRVRRKDLPGVPVTPLQQPELWHRVHALATIVGTRPPSEIRLVSEVNAAVVERTHLLGLLPGKRFMLIGVPLLQGLTVPELEGVLAHELGHYSDRHLRLAPLAGRARASAMRAVEAAHKQTGKTGKFQWPGSDLFEAVFAAYERLVLRETFAISREQEYAADRIAAQAGGRENAANALSKLPALDAAFDFYLNEFIGPGLKNGLFPPPDEVLGGFGRFLADPARIAEMAEFDADPANKEKAHQFDSHPPTADRVAAILALPPQANAAVGTPAEATVPAVALLRDLGPLLAAMGVKLLGKRAAGARVADWDTLARTAQIEGARNSALPIVQIIAAMIGRQARFTDFLGLVEAGRLPEILDRMELTATAKRLNPPSPAVREFKKNALGRALGAWIVVELVPSGQATIRHSWSSYGGEVQLPDGLEDALEEGIEGLLTMWPDTARIRQVVPA